MSGKLIPNTIKDGDSWQGVVYDLGQSETNPPIVARTGLYPGKAAALAEAQKLVEATRQTWRRR